VSHRRGFLSLFKLVLSKGLALGSQSFLPVFPLSLLMATLEFALQPQTKPSFVDSTDWFFVFLFFLGLLALAAFHAAILLRINALRKGISLPLQSAITQGIEKGIWVFSVMVVYVVIVFLGFLFFIIPGFYLGVSLYFSIFLVVIHEYKKGVPWYRKLKNYFSESFDLVWGHWWLTFVLLLIVFGVFSSIEQICLLLETKLILAVIFCVLAKASILPFWYACILALLFELKKHH